MIVLSKDQKREVYEWTLKNFKRFKGGPYLTNIFLACILGSRDVTYNQVPNIVKVFPEIACQKPDNLESFEDYDSLDFWHNDEIGNLQRELALIKALQMLDE